MRALLGGAKEVHHDPGPTGESGEGEAVIAKFCVVYVLTASIMVYERFFRRREVSASERAKSMLESRQNSAASMLPLPKESQDDSVNSTTAVELAATAAQPGVCDSTAEQAAACSGDGDVENPPAGATAAEELADEHQGLTEEELADKLAQEKWTRDSGDHQLEEHRRAFVRRTSCGLVDFDNRGCVGGVLYFLSGVNWYKLALVVFVVFALWVFLLTLSVMGTGFKLLGGKSSAQMFDVVDNPISALMVGVLATVLVQSSSTSTSIIISLVGANELSVRAAVFMVMGANIGTSVTNTIVALGYFASKNDLRRGFAAATVHDLFNWLSVLVLLPINWIYPFLEKMTYEMAKGQSPCDEDAGDKCVKQEFIKPFISPYSKGVVQYDKKVADYVSQGYCAGQCQTKLSEDQMAAVTALVCEGNAEAGFDCHNLPGYSDSWMCDGGVLCSKRAPAYVLTGNSTDAGAAAAARYLHALPEDYAGVVKEGLGLEPQPFFDAAGAPVADPTPAALYRTCDEYKTGLCDKRLLKGGLMLDDWHLSDGAAGALAVVMSLLSLCCCLYLIVYCLQRIVKGAAARILRRVVGFNGYVSIVIGCVITILVQSSSITTSTLTPLCAVGLIPLEDMFPLTLGANVGTTLTGIMAATVVASNPVEAWQVALCHLFFNIFGIAIWYPVPLMRRVPLGGARLLGRLTARYGWPFPVAYTSIVFFIFPAIVYGITVAAQK